MKLNKKINIQPFSKFLKIPIYTKEDKKSLQNEYDLGSETPIPFFINIYLDIISLDSNILHTSISLQLSIIGEKLSYSGIRQNVSDFEKENIISMSTHSLVSRGGYRKVKLLNSLPKYFREFSSLVSCTINLDLNHTGKGLAYYRINASLKFYSEKSLLIKKNKELYRISHPSINYKTEKKNTRGYNKGRKKWQTRKRWFKEYLGSQSTQMDNRLNSKLETMFEKKIKKENDMERVLDYKQAIRLYQDKENENMIQRRPMNLLYPEFSTRSYRCNADLDVTSFKDFDIPIGRGDFTKFVEMDFCISTKNSFFMDFVLILYCMIKKKDIPQEETIEMIRSTSNRKRKRKGLVNDEGIVTSKFSILESRSLMFRNGGVFEKKYRIRPIYVEEDFMKRGISSWRCIFLSRPHSSQRFNDENENIFYDLNISTLLTQTNYIEKNQFTEKTQELYEKYKELK